jgi:predicted amidohydrolase YtcJ
MRAVTDLLLYNCNLRNPDGSRASAVMFRERRVDRVGDSRDLLQDAGPGTARIDLGGLTVVPGFNDAHAHIWKIGHLLTTMLDLRKTTSIVELQGALRERDRQLPNGAWLIGRGFNELAMAEKRRPTRGDLDQAVPDRPVALTRTCGHIYATNSAALRLAGIGANTNNPPGGVIERDERGEPTGLLHETAMGLINRVMPAPTQDEYRRMLRAALEYYLSLGITYSADCGVIPELLEVYRSMDREGALPSRVLVMPLRKVDGRSEPVPLPEKHVSDRLRVDTVKFLADGGLSGATAAMSVPYRHANTRGTLRFEKDELQKLAKESHDAGWRIATHAIGDVAIDLVLDVYESLGPHPLGLKHRIEHFGLPSPEQLRRAAGIGVISVPQAIFIRTFGPNFVQTLPDGFAPRCYPIRGMLDAGLTVALSSDAPVVDDENPMAGMNASVTRRSKDGTLLAPEQAITLRDAFYGYTMGGAIAAGDTQSLGSIEPGKWADVAVLSGDPLSVEPDSLEKIHVEMTFVAGEKVYQR